MSLLRLDGKPAQVFVTGATGYIGSWLVRELVNEGANVTALVRSSSSLSLLEPFLDRIELHRLSADVESLRSVFQTVKPDLVIHLAASTGQRETLESVASILDANIVFGTQLLQAMVDSGCRRFIPTSTFWQNQTATAAEPLNLYAAAKEAFEGILGYYSAAYSIRIASLELFDVYGPRDPRKKILSLLCQSAKTGMDLGLTAGEQRIYPVHVADVVRAYLAVAKRLLSEEPLDGKLEKFAVRASAGVRVREFVETFESALGRKLPIKWGAIPYRPREIFEPRSRHTAPPGWEPERPLEEGLAEIIEGEA